MVHLACHYLLLCWFLRRVIIWNHRGTWFEKLPDHSLSFIKSCKAKRLKTSGFMSTMLNAFNSTGRKTASKVKVEVRVRPDGIWKIHRNKRRLSISKTSNIQCVFGQQFNSEKRNSSCENARNKTSTEVKQLQMTGLINNFSISNVLCLNI
jgi:hypothetical protein